MSSSDDEDVARASDALPRPLPDPVRDPAGAAPARTGADGLRGDPGGPGGGPGAPETLEYERRDAGGAPVPLEPALVTLALLPRSQWQSLVHLDAITVRLLMFKGHIFVVGFVLECKMPWDGAAAAQPGAEPGAPGRHQGADPHPTAAAPSSLNEHPPTCSCGSCTRVSVV